MKLYKGSIYPINVAFAPCYCQDKEVAISDLVLHFYTTEGGASIEFSGDSITVSGFVATVVFQPEQLDSLEDGVLRFTSEFNYGDSAIKWSCATNRYLLTPPSYTPIQVVTEDNVQGIVNDTISASTAITEIAEEKVREVLGNNYYTSGQTDEKIQEAISGIDLSGYYTSAQTDSKIATATQDMVTSTYVNKIWVGTTTQYNAIPTKDSKTLYFIKDN